MKKVIRIVAGVVLGYALMVVLITLVQETWFEGVSWHESSYFELAVSGLLTCVSGAIGAIIATAVARSARIPALIMSAMVVIETTVLTITGKLSGPLWFDLLAAGSLIAAILIGAELLLRLKRAQDSQQVSY